MKAFLTRYTVRFKQLKTNDQRMLVLLVSFLTVIVGYAAVWQPVFEFRESQLSDRERNLALLTMMKQTEAQARAGVQSSPMQAYEGNVLSAITNAANEQDISPNRLQPEGDASVSLWFEAVVFSDLLMLLDRLDREQGIGVDQMVIDRTENSGQVRARLVLSRTLM